MRHHTESIHPIFIKHGLIALDIDKFKSINDSFGHNKGDEVLSALVRVASENLRMKDVFCRNGGEEFFIICPDTDAAGCFILAEKLRQRVESHAFPIGRQVTASFGITEFSYGETITSITERADRALYRAKVAGRNRIEIEESA
ncbi:diguanylate cyclase (GGDEF)-like protein [Pseudomonas psychrotolerans]|nr:diguanylate cyclase (GGDEF)-like protein [Pseudomonas psychrotolerans]